MARKKSSRRARPGEPTPMMRQYQEAKQAHPDAILFFRMGDFFEMFHDDAVICSKLLGITLTSRGPKGSDTPPVPMAGVPHHAVEGYVARLVRLGHKVALCDQVEDASQARGIVRRGVTRVATPGTTADEQTVDAGENVFLAALVRQHDRIGLGLVNLSTGRLDVTEVPADAAAEARIGDELARYQPREILTITGSDLAALLPPDHGAALTERPGELASPTAAVERLRRHLGVTSLSAFGLEDREAATAAAGLLFAYLEETQKSTVAHVRGISYVNSSHHVALDAASIRNLELVRSMADGSRRSTLLEVVDRTSTPMGARLLRERLVHPDRRQDELEARLEAVRALVADGATRGQLGDVGLDPIRDLERLLSRITMATAGPRDVLAMRESLRSLPAVRATLETLDAPRLQQLAKAIDELPDVLDLLDRALTESPPVKATDGGVIQPGFDAELDELRSAATGGKTWIAEYEARQRAETGIGSLKIRFHKILGYSIEVTNANRDAVPEHYRRRQSLSNMERYTTDELTDREALVRKAETDLTEIELAVFARVRAEVAAQAERIAATAAAIAEVDVHRSFAEVAAEHGWCRPELGDDGTLEIEDGRHPVVEQGLVAERFTPNDLRLDPDERQVVLVTGPNMGGKSTYLRQAALIVLLAHAGAYVPARRARIPLVDRIFTRVGASDDLARGRSTFMVEMTETANILHNATSRSLVILDEVGRGTSTFDGLSLAWAIVEHLHEHPRDRPLVLFATHYHELTDLASMLARVANVRVVIRQHQGKVVFVHRIEDGASDRSYGIEVAKLAGLPDEVVERARQVLRDLEAVELGLEERLRPKGGREPSQMTLFVPATHPVLEELKRIDSDALTPLDALNKLAELARLAKEQM